MSCQVPVASCQMETAALVIGFAFSGNRQPTTGNWQPATGN
jgi:hypothetical protein